MNHSQYNAENLRKNTHDEAHGNLRNCQKQRLDCVKFHEAVLFFGNQKNNSQHQANATKKIRDVAKHRAHIRFQSQTCLAAGRAGWRASCVVWR